MGARNRALLLIENNPHAEHVCVVYRKQRLTPNQQQQKKLNYISTWLKWVRLRTNRHYLSPNKLCVHKTLVERGAERYAKTKDRWMRNCFIAANDILTTAAHLIKCFRISPILESPNIYCVNCASNYNSTVDGVTLILICVIAIIFITLCMA